MPRLTKKRAAAKAREMAKKQIRQSAVNLLVPPVEFGPEPEPKYYQELPVEDAGPSLPLEPTIEIDVKQEPVYTTGGESQLLLQEEVEVKEELLDPENAGPVDGEQDPIGQTGGRALFHSKEEESEEHDTRCEFCLTLFQESGGRGIITKSKIEYVLGFREWGAPGRRPDCCEGCRRMFELFYEFKQSCLMALARPAELFVWAGNKGPTQFVDLKPIIRKKPKSTTERKAGQIKKSKTVKAQKMEDFHESVVSSEQESHEPDAVRTEALSAELQQDVEEAQCVICNKRFSDGLALRQHLSKHYPTELKESDTKLSEKNSSTPFTFELDTRLEPVKKEKKTYCGRCRKWFPVKAVYLEHKPACIENFERNKPAPPEFACSQCPKKFLRQQDLTWHINMHNGVRTIPCRREGCTKMFYNPNIRHNHEKICGQEVHQEICSICGSIFRSLSALRIHLATHGDRQFTCEICNKSFYTKANLKKHAAAHSDERKFQCKVCGKRFKSHEANRVHQRIHTEEKPYICHICGQRFTYNCMLKTHLEKGHESVPAPNAEVVPPNPFGELGY